MLKQLFLLLNVLCLLGTHAQNDDDEDNEPSSDLTSSFGDLSGITVKDFNPELSRTTTPQIKINNIVPDRGPTYGETRVLVRVGPLSRWEDIYTDPVVRASIVNAFSANSVKRSLKRLTCAATNRTSVSATKSMSARV